MLQGNKGSASMTMVITAAAVSGIVALGVTRVMSLQYNAVSSTADKMRAQHDALNRAEIIRASTYASLTASSKELEDGFFEDVTVSEDFESGFGVKTAKVNIYKDKTKKELISSMIVKRTNPTIALANEYKSDGSQDTAYTVSAVNKHFAHTGDEKNGGNVGSAVKPVYVKDGTLVEGDFANAAKSDSDKIAVINPDGTFGYLTKNDFLAGQNVSTVTIGVQSSDGGTFTRVSGAEISTVPRIGQILIVTNNNSLEMQGVGKRVGHADQRLALQDSSGNVGPYYKLRADYGLGHFSAGQGYDTPNAPFVLFFNGENWLMVGCYFNVPGKPEGYAYSG